MKVYSFEPVLVTCLVTWVVQLVNEYLNTVLLVGSIAYLAYRLFKRKGEE